MLRIVQLSRGRNALVHNASDMSAGVRKPGPPAMPLGMDGAANGASRRSGAAGSRDEADDSTRGTGQSTSSQPQEQSGLTMALASGTAGSPTEAGRVSDETLDAANPALTQKSSQQTHQGQRKKGFWGYITDYIIGADKLIQ